MKKIRLLSLLWIILFASTLAGCWGNKEVNSNNTWNDEWNLVIEDTTPENDTVINYNDTLVDLASQCIMSESNVRSVYNDENAKVEDIQKTIEKTINECTKAWNDIEELWDREWDSSLKNWVLSIIEKEIALYTKFSQLLPYFEKDELTEDEEAAYDNLFSIFLNIFLLTDSFIYPLKNLEKLKCDKITLNI